MAKQPLRVWMKDKLKNAAHNMVSPAVEQKAYDRAYAKAAPLVLRAVHAKYRPDEMAVLKKHSVARSDACIKLQFPDGAVSQFEFYGEDQAPLIPDLHSCRHRIYLADEKTSAAVAVWVSARDALRDEKTKRIKAYSALIDASAYVEDVVKHWPEAAEIVPPSQQLIHFNPDQLDVINADRKERRAA